MPEIKKAFHTFLFTELVSEFKVSGKYNESEAIRNIEVNESVVRKCEISVE